MKSLIFGYGVTGQSFDRYLTNKGLEFDIYDKITLEQKNSFATLPDIRKLESYEMIYLSPGINLKKLYPDEELNKVNYKTDVDIFFEENRSFKVGITGTNGKSTCCMHLNQLLESSQILGNFGRPLLDAIHSKHAYSIIELSSFQLEKMKNNHLDFGVLLNIAPDHIDHHGNLENYINAKNRILQSKQSTTQSNPFLLFKEITGTKYLGDIQPQDLINLPHRLEKLKLNNKITIINDSKSTNTNSLKYAIEKFSRDSCHHLIVMGDPDKERYDFIELEGPKNIYICGEHAEELDEKISHHNKYIFQSLEDTLRFIKKLSGTLEILFSPGHPSGQDYKNFEARGNHFMLLSKEIFNDW